MIEPLQFTFSANLWLSGGKSPWHFITLPAEESEEIKFFSAFTTRRGWGSLRVTARIGETTWKTSIFPGSKGPNYILPVKADVRRRESLKAGDQLRIELEVRV